MGKEKGKLIWMIWQPPNEQPLFPDVIIGCYHTHTRPLIPQLPTLGLPV